MKHLLLRAAPFAAGIALMTAGTAFAACPDSDPTLSCVTGVPAATNTGEFCTKAIVNGVPVAIDAKAQVNAAAMSTNLLLARAQGQSVSVVYYPSNAPSCMGGGVFNSVVDVN